MALTHGSQAVIRYVAETAAGTFPTNPALTLFSKETRRIRVGLDKNLQEMQDIDDFVLDGFSSVTNAYSLEVEYVLYDVDAYTAFLARASDGTTSSFSIEIVYNQDHSVVHYQRGTGWRPDTVRLSGQVDGKWMVTVTFVGGVFTTAVTTAPSLDTTGTRQAKSGITDAVRTFSSGAITSNGAAWAVLLNDFEVTVSHGTQARYTTGNANPIAAGVTFGKRRIEGSATFSLDDGSKTHYDLVDAFGTRDIVVPFSTTTGQPKITFSGCVFPSLEVDVAADTDVLMGSQPFRATTYTVGTV